MPHSIDSAPALPFSQGSAAPLRLHAGQVLTLRARSGTLLVPVRGVLRIREAPVWLGEQMVERRFSAREGDPHTVRESGWISIVAQQACELGVVQPGAGSAARPAAAIVAWFEAWFEAWFKTIRSAAKTWTGRREPRKSA